MKRSALLSVFLVVFTNLLGFGIIIPLLPLYAETFQATAFEIGLLTASYTAMQFLFAPILGRWSDRLGRRPVLLLCLAGTMVSFLLLGLARSLAVLFAARILDGITGGNISVAQAYITDVTDPKERARGLGLIGAAFGLGFVFGPALGGLLSRAGFAAPAFVAAAITAISLGLAWFLLPESLPPDRRTKLTLAKPQAGPSSVAGRFQAALHRPELRQLFSTLGLVSFAWSCFQSTFVLFAHRRLNLTAESEGLWLAYIGVLAAILQGGLIGRLSRRFGESHLVLTGAFALVLGTLLLSRVFQPVWLLLIFPILAIGNGLSMPSLASLTTRLSVSEDVGAMLGVYQSVDSLARIAGNLVGNYSLDALGTSAPMILASLAAVLAVLLAWRMVKRNR